MTNQNIVNMRKGLLPALVIGILEIAACSGVTSPRDVSSTKIANGDVVASGDLTARGTVGLVQPSPNSQGAFEAYCSGTLIEQDLVVTAAHCIISPQILVAFGLDLTESPVVIAGRGYAHEKFESPSSPDFTYDLALIRLSQKAPDFMQPIAIAQPTDFSKGDEVLLAGYGLVVAKGSKVPTDNPGMLYKVSTRISEIYPEPPISSTASMRADPEALFGLIGFKSGDGRSGGCEGDSGGPMYLPKNNSLLLIGSTVGGPGVCAASGFYSNLSQYAPWIRQTAQKLKAPQI